MSWRTVVIQTHSKLSYKDGYMIVKGESMNMVHLSEIGTLVVKFNKCIYYCGTYL